jgi:hypothetical protein
MAISYKFTKGTIWLKVRGEDSLQDLSEGIFQAMADEKFGDGKSLVLDLQDTKADFSSADLRFLASFLEEKKGKLFSPILAIVSDSLHFGLMRMLQTYAESYGFELKIYKEEQEAIECLPVFKPETNQYKQKLNLTAHG